MNIQRNTARELAKGFPAQPAKWKPCVWWFTYKNNEVLVKDVRYTSLIYRFLLGRWILQREAKIYQRLQGIARIPHFHGWLDQDALLMQRVAASPIQRDAIQTVTNDFFIQLRRIISNIHQRGIVHLDLRQKRNILIGSDKLPWIVDFGGAIFIGTNWFSRRFLLPLFAWIDFSSIVKFRVRYLPHLASESEKQKDARNRILRRIWIFSRHHKR